MLASTIVKVLDRFIEKDLLKADFCGDKVIFLPRDIRDGQDTYIRVYIGDDYFDEIVSLEVTTDVVFITQRDGEQTAISTGLVSAISANALEDE